MKKYIIYFFTSISAIWFIDMLLSGYVFIGGSTTIFLIILFILVGIYLTEWVVNMSRKESNTFFFFLVGSLITFFSLYFASLFLSNFSIGSGSLSSIKIGFLSTPVIKSMDQILSLVIGAIIATGITTLCRGVLNNRKITK